MCSQDDATGHEGQSRIDESGDLKAILKKLHEDASDEVKRLIKGYDPEEKHDANLKSILKCSTPTLEVAAVYLGGKPRDEANQVKYKSRETLADWLIMAIEGLFPQHCVACDTSYTIQRGDTPRFRCAYCWGGSHDCDQITSQPTMKVRGFMWVCWECMKKNELETFTEGDEEDPPLSAASTAQLHRKFSYPEVKDDNTSGEPGDDESNTRQKKKNEIRTDSGAVKLEDVCDLYLQKRCRHGWSGNKKVQGVTCTKKHPPLCRKFTSYGTTRRQGCQKGSDCRFFHPPLCKNSEIKRQCFNPNCRNTHLKFTDRVRSGDQPGFASAAVKGTKNHQGPSTQDRRFRTKSAPGGPQNSSQEQQPHPVASPQLTTWNEQAFLDRMMGLMESRIAELIERRIPPTQPATLQLPHSSQLQVPQGNYTISPHARGLGY